MGILDDLKHKAEALGDKAREGFDTAKDKAGDLLDDAKDKAGDLIDDAKERIGHDDDSAPLAESGDVGPDSSSTDAEQPGYVTGEDDVDDTESDEASLNGADDSDEADDSLDDADDTDDSAGRAEAVVATDVDPYDAPLTETIGDDIASAPVDSAAVSDAVGTTSGQDA